MPAQFVLRKTANDRFHFNLTAENNKVILTSQTYASKSGAENGIASVRDNAADDARYQRLTSKDGKFYFNLQAANNKVIGNSEMYTTQGARDNGIEAVKRVGPGAPVSDRT
jgi:uncharacterized protein YegP (UPF0339 family)